MKRHQKWRFFNGQLNLNNNNEKMQYYNSDTVIYRDGKFEKAAQSKTDLYGQSLHYGYAVFEGIRAYQTHNGTRIFKAREHFERLKRSAELVHIPFTWDIDDLIKQTYKLLKLNNLKLNRGS